VGVTRPPIERIKQTMQTTFPITGEALKEILEFSVSNVFDTMLELPVALTKTVEVTEELQQQGKLPVLETDQIQVVGTVGFIGSVNGIIYLFLEHDLAIKLTGKFLGMENWEVEAEGQEMINDGLGEITNMITGNFKNKLCDHGLDCKLTIPSILRGNHFSVETNASVMRRIFFFETLQTTFMADLFLKPNE